MKVATTKKSKFQSPRYDLETVRSAVTDWGQLFIDIGGMSEELLDATREHPCPKCAGDTRCRFIDKRAGAVRCSHCFSEQCGDGFSTLAWLLDLPMPKSLPKVVQLVAEYVGVAPGERSSRGKPSPAQAKSREDGKKSRMNRAPSAKQLLAAQAAKQVHADLSDDDFLAAVCATKKMPAESAKAFGARVRVWSQVETGCGNVRVVEFSGHDGDGRLNPLSWFGISYFADAEKFHKGAYVIGGEQGVFLPHDADGHPRLPQPGEVWHLVEGVKDAAAMHSLGYLVAGLPTKQLNAKFAELFRGVEVVLVPDLDDGQKGAAVTAERLAGIAASIRIARLPGEVVESHGADVRDVLASHGEEAVRRAISEALEWVPAKDEGAKSKTSENARASLFKLTDMGNAERFAKQHGENVRYCHVWNSWLVWDGTRWAVDSMGEVERLAKRTVRSIIVEAADENIEYEESKEISKWAHSSERSPALKAMIALGRSEEPIPIAVESLDAEPWLLNCENGTIDLTTGVLREHRREDFLTKRCPVEYPTEPGDDPVLWLTFLDQIFAGDHELIAYMQRLMGVSLAGVVRDHMLPILWGNGCNGKSVFVETWCSMLGEDYAMKAPQGFMMAKRGESHPTELADLYGKRLVAAVETADRSRLSESLVKELTGGDTIRARRMREDFWQFKPSHTAIMATNHRPGVLGTDHGLWRRLRLVPFTVTITNKDERLAEKLRAELPAILRWAVDGCLTWQRSGLQEPLIVMAATEEYRSKSDVFGSFLEECCLTSTTPEIRAKYSIKASTLYSLYKKWCEANGEYAESQTKFGTRLGERSNLGLFSKKTTGVIKWFGITNREIPKEENEDEPQGG